MISAERGVRSAERPHSANAPLTRKDYISAERGVRSTERLCSAKATQTRKLLYYYPYECSATKRGQFCILRFAFCILQYSFCTKKSLAFSEAFFTILTRLFLCLTILIEDSVTRGNSLSFLNVFIFTNGGNDSFGSLLNSGLGCGSSITFAECRGGNCNKAGVSIGVFAFVYVNVVNVCPFPLVG